MEIIITADWFRVYDEHGQDFASWPVVDLTAELVMAVINAVHAGERADIEALVRTGQ